MFARPEVFFNMHVSALVWIITIMAVMGFIVFDFYTHVRTPHNPTMKEAGTWTAFYVVLALIFGEMVWRLRDHHRGIEFLSGYITEKVLSVDNLFVFALIIGVFKIPRQYQRKVLPFGIAMALVFRGLFIWAGTAVIARWSDVFYLFAIFLIYTAIKTVYDEAVDKPEPDPSDMKLIRWLRRIVPISDHYNRDKLTVKENGKRYSTPLAITLASIGFIDAMFAFNSIPAICGLTDEVYIVSTANALALMGLRQMYFSLNGLLDRLVYLVYGLGAILVFIGVKLLLHALHESNLPFIDGGENVSVPEVSTWRSLAFIVIILVVTVPASWLKIKRDENMGAVALPRAHHNDHGNDDGPGSHASSTSGGEESVSAGNKTNGSHNDKNEPERQSNTIVR